MDRAERTIIILVITTAVVLFASLLQEPGLPFHSGASSLRLDVSGHPS
jgi:hypothetical protein